MRRIDLLVVHHSASPRDTTTLEKIDEWHKARGWGGCGYHFVVEADGRLRFGRRIEHVGAHVKGHNANSIGVCVVGNNLEPAEKWTVFQQSALRHVIGAARTLWPELRVCGHRDLAATDCPGREIDGFGGGPA